MKSFIYLLLFSLITTFTYAQRDFDTMCKDSKFDAEVNNLLDYSVPVISVEELKKMGDDIILFDARELKEYKTSHIKNAKYVGYDQFTTKNIEEIDKSKKVVVYCSIGYRSEKIGVKLKGLGYTNIYNLYGSIFEWVNQGNKLVTPEGDETKKLHTYDKNWSKWVNNPDIEKVY